MDGKPKGLAILGSTGSIGEQTLQVVAEQEAHFRVVGLAARRRVERLGEQARRWRPEVVAAMDLEAARLLQEELKGEGIPVLAGMEGLEAVATWPSAELVVCALSGAVGLRPLLAAIGAGKDVAVANKEPLVAAGQLVMEEVRRRGVRFLPIDSEHSAIFQCLHGEPSERIARLWLTASGGPFRQRSPEELERVTAEEALQHPTWRMGAKITIDSATLMNKGLEVIEAHWLFEVPLERIEILIHPQSIVHSLVEFVDGSILAQLDRPDMRGPIQFALTYPQRLPTRRPRLDLRQLAGLTFEPPDYRRFPCPLLAYEAARRGGTLPAVMNAANEVAVTRFLEGEIRFTDIPRLIEAVMAQHEPQPLGSLEMVLAADAWAREAARAWKTSSRKGGEP